MRYIISNLRLRYTYGRIGKNVFFRNIYCF